MTTHYLSIVDLAAHINITPNTARAYRKQGRLPDPDVIIGQGQYTVAGWSTNTIDQWQHARPGRGNPYGRAGKPHDH